MVLEALPGPQRDGLQKGYQFCRQIPSTAALAQHLSQGEVKAGQVMAGFTPRTKQSRNRQRPEPGPVLERLDRSPGIEGERGREKGRQVTGALDHAPPLAEAGALVPLQLIDERERVLRADR